MLQSGICSQDQGELIDRKSCSYSAVSHSDSRSYMQKCNERYITSAHIHAYHFVRQRQLSGPSSHLVYFGSASHWQHQACGALLTTKKGVPDRKSLRGEALTAVNACKASRSGRCSTEARSPHLVAIPKALRPVRAVKLQMSGIIGARGPFKLRHVSCGSCSESMFARTCCAECSARDPATCCT